MNWYIKCINNYTNFSGRARRKEYWTFALINYAVVIVLGFCIGFFGEINENVSLVFVGILFIYALFVLVPHLAVVVRRLHDVGKSGAYWFVRFIPFIGPFWLLFLLLQDSDENNRYGLNPKNPTNEIDSIGTL